MCTELSLRSCSISVLFCKQRGFHWVKECWWWASYQARSRTIPVSWPWNPGQRSLKVIESGTVHDIWQYQISDNPLKQYRMWYWPKAANVTHGKSTVFVVWRQLLLCSSVNELSATSDSENPERISITKPWGSYRNYCTSVRRATKWQWSRPISARWEHKQIWQMAREEALPIYNQPAPPSVIWVDQQCIA